MTGSASSRTFVTLGFAFCLLAACSSPARDDRSADVGTRASERRASVGSDGTSPIDGRAVASRGTTERKEEPSAQPSPIPMEADAPCAAASVANRGGATVCRDRGSDAEAAADVVRRYYSAIDAHDLDTAWRQWGKDGPPGRTRASFDQGFAHTASASVSIGPIPPGDAGAGSIY